MANWYDALVSHAKDEEYPVLLYSLQTRLGELQIVATLATFKIALGYGKGTLWLALNESRSVGLLEDACDAVLAASRHKSGIRELDTSDEKISDYLLDWKVRVGQRLIFNYIDLWIRENINGSLREMVDYFEHDATHLVNRGNLSGFLEEMIVSGQVERLPRDWMTPAELDHILHLAKEYGVELPDNRYAD